jgi:hypothetical protein
MRKPEELTALRQFLAHPGCSRTRHKVDGTILRGGPGGLKPSVLPDSLAYKPKGKRGQHQINAQSMPMKSTTSRTEE